MGVDDDEPQSPEEIRALIAEARRKKDEAQRMAQLPKRDAKGRRALEHNQRKGRVNQALLDGKGRPPGRDERWTILARPDLIKQVKALADELSAPRAKVSVAALMEEAIQLLLAKYSDRDQIDA